MLSRLKKTLFGTFKWRIIASVMALYALLTTLIVWDVTQRQSSFAKEQSIKSSKSHALALAANSAAWILSNDLKALSELIEGVQRDPSVKAAYLIDRNGRVRAAIDRAAHEMLFSDNVSLELLSAVQKSKNGVAVIQHDNLMDAVATIKIENDTVGFARVILDDRESVKELASIRKNGIIYTLAAIVIGGILTYLAVYSLTLRIERLSRTADRIGKGELDALIEKTNRDDEVGKLETAFASMVQALQDRIEEITHSKAQLKAQAEELERLNKNLETAVAQETAKRISHEHLLIQQSKMAAMGEMLSSIAHQWRQPINAIGILIQDIKDAYEFGELDKEYIEGMINKSMAQIQFMSKTIDDFRNFYAPSKQKEHFNVCSAIRSVLELSQAQLKNKNVKVELQCQIDDDDFEGYENEFKQVILNIVKNGQDAIVQLQKNKNEQLKGAIEIKMDRDGERLYITIEDNGGGIPQEIMDKIFDPYFTTKEQGQGTGIGLYMSKLIIENSMGGKLTAGNGKNGAEFTIVL